MSSQVKVRRVLGLLVSVALGVAVIIGWVASAEAAPESSAQAEIRGCEDEGISGTATLKERPSPEGVKLVDIEIRVQGMAPGKHAVHIHEVGTCDPCGAAKGHFDPGPNSNSSPDGNHPFHMGDLINLDIDESGKGRLRTITSRITLSPGPLSVLDENGSAFIIHVDPDTSCPEGEAKGCAGGSRAACGVIATK
jgi:Cu-Zn family superoxide dismutase